MWLLREREGGRDKRDRSLEMMESLVEDVRRSDEGREGGKMKRCSNVFKSTEILLISLVHVSKTW